MKKILIFLRENISYDTINYFARTIAGNLNKLGVENGFFDITRFYTSPPDRDTLMEIARGGYDAALAFNAVGQQDYMLDGENLYDKAGIPFFNYIVDHPIEHQVALKSKLKDYNIICVDKNHASFAKKYFPGIKNAYFLPLAGLEGDGQPQLTEEDFENRPYDVVFTGTAQSLAEFERRISEYPDRIKNLVIAHIEYMLEHRDCTLEGALRAVLTDYGFGELPDETFLNFSVSTAITSSYIKAYYREEVIRYLLQSDVNLDIFGAGWEQLADESKGRVKLHSFLPYTETAKLCAGSRLVLNIMPLFKDGQHDRIPTAMLNGAAVLTDHSLYLDENLSDRLFFFDIDHPERVGDIINQTLSDKKKLYETARDNIVYAYRNMTWENTTAKLLEMMDRG